MANIPNYTQLEIHIQEPLFQINLSNTGKVYHEFIS